MVIVFAENQNGQFKKTAFEAVTYGYKTAQLMGAECIALVLGSVQTAGELGKYGASKVYQVADAQLDEFDSQMQTAVIAEAVKALNGQVLVMTHSANGKALLGRLAVRLNAGSVAGAIAVPTVDGAFKVKKTVFSGKAIAEYQVNTDIKLISIIGNSIPPEEFGEPTSTEALSVSVPAAKVKVKEVKRVEGTVPLPEAEKVVSAGRGMKGPENWG